MTRNQVTPPSHTARRPNSACFWAVLILVALYLPIGCRAAEPTNNLLEPATVQPQNTPASANPAPTSSPKVATSSVPTQTATSEVLVAVTASGSEPVTTAGNPQSYRPASVHQSWEDVPVKRFEGEYNSVIDHHDGRFSLTHTGPTITAVFSTSRSAVQHYARTGERLFYLPKPVQPANNVIWEVQGWPVTMEGQGTSEPGSPHTFRIQVGSDGNVEYLHDRGVDGLEYLRYTVNLAWPAPGVEPQVCNRDPEVQRVILEAIPSSHCAQVTWAQLASIRYLKSSFSISSDTDLAGLTGLEFMSLKLRDGVDLTSALAQVPRLKDLGLSLSQEELSNEFLKSNTLISNLELQSIHSALPVGFLDDMYNLDRVSFEFPELRKIPEGFLTSTQQLNHLSLSFPELTDLPDGFLSFTPELTSLTISLPRLVKLPDGFLSQTPQLARLDLSIPRLTELPAGFLANAPNLESLRLSAPGLKTIAPEVWTQLEAHSPEVVVMGSAQKLYHRSTSQAATKGWARPGRRLEIVSRQETPEGKWVQVKGHGDDFGSGDYAVAYYWRMWLKDPQLAPAGFPLVTFGPVVEGRFLRQDLSLGSRYRLQRTGSTVIATFEVDSSPVQYLARTQPAVLFEIPPDFRPAEEIVWEVDGWPVNDDSPSATGSAAPRRFRLRITTEGHVRYVDDVGVDGVGHLKYKVSLAWPLPGASPDVCTRSQDVQKAVLKPSSLTDCTEVTWEHLARIRQLKGILSVSQPHDLAGLRNLESVELKVGDGPGLGAILAQMPRLQHLKLNVYYSATLSPEALYSLAQLKSLEVHPSGGLILPADFLIHTPLLESLHLGGVGGSSRGTNSLPETFLEPVPQLKRFHWASTSDTSVPSNLLRYTPELEELELAAYRLAKLPTDSLRYVPNLTALEIWSRKKLGLPSDFLVPVPRLTRLRLVNGSEIPISFDFLVPTPRLQTLELWLGQFKGLSTHFLTAVPQLNNLEIVLGWMWPGSGYLDLEIGPGPLFSPSHEPFPTDFLKHNPQLFVAKLSNYEDGLKYDSIWDYYDSVGQVQPNAPRVLRVTVQRPARGNVSTSKVAKELPLLLEDVHKEDLSVIVEQHADSATSVVVRTDSVSDWPDDLVSGFRYLRHFTLQADYLEPLPQDWLMHVSDLAHLILELDDRGNLPPGFVTLPSSVSYVTVLADEATNLHAGWLAHSPQVTHLTIQADSLNSLPHNLLSPFPNLTHLFLYTDQLEDITAGFLRSVPSLTHLTLQAGHLEELPHDFLAYSPNLSYLALHTHGVSSWPVNLMGPVRKLTQLILLGDNIIEFPADFLGALPQLRHFYLQADSLTSLPENFLADATDLVSLSLQLDSLGTLPPDFLERAPSLTHLVLMADQLTELPEHFVSNWSDLDHLSISTATLVLLPEYEIEH